MGRGDGPRMGFDGEKYKKHTTDGEKYRHQ